jgi:hypothetical protein
MPKFHRAQPKSANLQAGAAKILVLHTCSFLRRFAVSDNWMHLADAKLFFVWQGVMSIMHE